ncbi:hypothetical protein BCR32DRAFT_293876 [Anaeromyces robustus]|uniref:Uncharacterized protein n=1 Tax=Anaeromyces robustus TaxID=1754192 RepID=A0A1Y1X3H4_9FUNG|nr:hypothetical protein BCR32DRAFT_293876 [Anaeromyces robustus]|eukprot:ORX80360.1 hypothetical protein BCR32DRAFT_293876 [Anaeromyces robustus]
MKLLKLLFAIIVLAYSVFGKAIINEKFTEEDIDQLLSTWTVFAESLRIPTEYVINDINMIKNDPDFDINDSLFIKSFMKEAINKVNKNKKMNPYLIDPNIIPNNICCVCVRAPCPCQCNKDSDLDKDELKCFRKAYHTTDERYIKKVINKMKNTELPEVLTNLSYINYLECLLKNE